MEIILDGVIKRLFSRWPNRCPLDGGFITLESEPDGNVVFNCGWVHKITLEHWVAALEGCPITKAYQMLSEVLGSEFIPHSHPYKEYLKAIPLNTPVSIDFTPGGSSYWEERGFDQETQVRYDMGTVNGYPGLVYRDSKGDLKAWTGREPSIPENVLNPVLGQKYPHCKNTKRLLWGELFAKELQEKLKVNWVVLVEGCADAVRFLQAGIPAVASTQPSITPSQAIRLLDLTTNIIVCPDADIWGQRFLQNGVGRHYILPFAQWDWMNLNKKDPASYTPEELRKEFLKQFPESGL